MKWIIENRSRLEDYNALAVVRKVMYRYSFLPDKDKSKIGLASSLFNGVQYDVVISKNKNSIRLVVLNEQEAEGMG